MSFCIQRLIVSIGLVQKVPDRHFIVNMMQFGASPLPEVLNLVCRCVCDKFVTGFVTGAKPVQISSQVLSIDYP